MATKHHIYEFPDAKGIVVTGDIHGDFKALVYKCCVQYGMTDTLIVVAGDCGFGFHRPGYYDDLYMQLSRHLTKGNNWVLFIRGNHDNPAYFDGQQVNYKRWKAVQDYSVLKACGHTILCVGGAVSVDRGWRKNENYVDTGDGKLTPYVYWPDEKPVYDEAKLEAISKAYTIDTVITHTAPSCCELTSHQGIQDFLVNDRELLQDIKAERKVMDDIHTFLKEHGQPVRQWCYGHFHQSWHDEIDGIKYNMLDIMQINQLDSDYVDTEYEKRMERLATLASKFHVF